MRKSLLIITLMMTIFSCHQNNHSTNIPTDPNVHVGIALEKINTSQYTYLLVNENGVETWLAFPLAEVKIGDTYYYVNEMLMNNFVSKELGRTFEKVYFISEVFTEPPTKVAGGNIVNSNPQPLPPNHPQISQQSIEQPMPQDDNIINDPAAAESNPNMHKGIALEKINTSQYTYLLLNEKGVKNWLAFPTTDVKIGETYYYTGEMLMTNFESKELKRTFEKIFFVQGVTMQSSSTQKESNVNNMNAQQPMQNNKPYSNGAVNSTEKLNIKIEPAKQGLSIADLISKKEKYAGKIVVIKGKVTKFSSQIMGRNWIHIQDGSEFKGVFDLTITSQNTVKVGGIITCEGTLSLNKNFGAGYQYDMILENATVK